MASPEYVDVAVVGAGAAGIWAAERAAREGPEVVLLEKTPRVGTKILASGGQKCNLTTTRDARGAAKLFGDEGERFLRHALRAFPPSATRHRFREIGVPTKEAPLEKIFPESERAVDVRDALEHEARESGVEIRLEARVEGLAPTEHGWRVGVEGAEPVHCRRLLVCPGGKSYPGTGTTGDGYTWMEELGLDLVEPVPDLVGLTSPASWVDELAGLDVQDVEARVVDGEGRVLERRRRPVVWTHDGVSGPGAMDLAEWFTRPIAEGRRDGLDRRLELDLFPDCGHEDIRRPIVEAASAPGAKGVWSTLPGELPKRLFRAVCGSVGLEGKGLMVDDLPAKARDRLVDRLKRFRMPVDGSEGFGAAEVTAGGVDVDEIDPRTMRVKRHEGLYVFGEILNVQGPIGGLNFQAAWSEGELVGAEVAERL